MDFNDSNPPLDSSQHDKSSSQHHDKAEVLRYLKKCFQGWREELRTELQWLVNIQHAQDIVEKRPLTKFDFLNEDK